METCLDAMHSFSFINPNRHKTKCCIFAKVTLQLRFSALQFLSLASKPFPVEAACMPKLSSISGNVCKIKGPLYKSQSHKSGWPFHASRIIL